MKYFKRLTLIILTLSLLFCGCGGTSNLNNKGEYTFSEYVSSGETIWFLTDGLGKDAEIETIYVLETDGTLYYCSSNWTLGEAEKKTDDEISSTVKNKYTEDISAQISNRINNSLSVETCADAIGNTVLDLSGKDLTLSYSFGDIGVLKDAPTLYGIATECYEECISSINLSDDEYYNLIEQTSKVYAQKYVDWLIPHLTSKFELYTNDVKPAQYKLALTSDSTGNNTENEFFVFQDYAPLEKNSKGYYCATTELELSYISPYESDKGATNCANIYDSWYGGYSVKKGYFLTRVSEPKTFKLDTIGTENITVDDTDALFDTTVIIEAPSEIGG